MECLIRDLRKDLNAPNMPAVIGVMGIGGVNDRGQHRELSAGAGRDCGKPEFKGNVIAFETGKYWDHELAALSRRPPRSISR
jgi:hypothetical protein